MPLEGAMPSRGAAMPSHRGAGSSFVNDNGAFRSGAPGFPLEGMRADKVRGKKGTDRRTVGKANHFAKVLQEI